MKKIFYSFMILGVLLAGSSLVPSLAYATSLEGGAAVGDGVGAFGVNNKPDYSTGEACDPGKLCNPIKTKQLECFVKNVFDIILGILSVAAALYIMYAGFLFVKAQGNETELTKAKKALLNALIGTALILGAWAFATVIAKTISQITNQSVEFKQCPSIL